MRFLSTRSSGSVECRGFREDDRSWAKSTDAVRGQFGAHTCHGIVIGTPSDSSHVIRILIELNCMDDLDHEPLLTISIGTRRLWSGSPRLRGWRRRLRRR